MNANTAFYLQNAGQSFQSNGIPYRAAAVNGEVQVYNAASLARSYNPDALRAAAQVLELSA